MVVCAMQSFARGQQLDGCSAMKTAQNTQTKDAGIVDNGNGAEEEDREEGEIVDEFEMIISSEDEEFKLRARIQQLEDKSKDIEKMEMLSANLANQYNYQRPHRIDRYTPYQRFSPISVLSDVSSLSGEEFEPPKKYRKHKSKRTESKRHGQMLRRNPFARRSQDQKVKKTRRHEHHNNHSHYYQQQQTAILLDSLDSVTDDEIGEYDMDNENDEYDLEQLKLSRDKLRVALARAGSNDMKPKHSLKERLKYRMHKSPSPNSNARENHLKRAEELSPRSLEDCSEHVRKNEQQQEKQELDHDDDTPELKLRLIALKSAIIKKHMARKKRDAERAYSPTDMINRVHQPTINNECDDIEDLMDISPAASPDRTVYSPPRTSFEEPVDMDLAQTDSDEDRQQWADNWQTTVNREESWRCFLPNSLPPVSMPIVIDDDEEQVDDDEVPPPPPSYHIPHMQLEDDDARDALHLSEQHSPQGSLNEIQSISMDNSQTQSQLTSRTYQNTTSDEEASALRALLLSKLKKPEGASVKTVESTALQCTDEARDSDDPDELRLLLLSSIVPKKSPENSPIILKKAVRRFQVTSSMEVKGASAEMQLETVEESLTTPSPMPLLVSVPMPVPAPVPAPVIQPEPVLAVHIPALKPVPVLESVPATSPVPAPLPVPPPQLPVEVAPTPIVPPSPTGIIKIVKPNKVINKKTAVKRKNSKLIQTAPPIKRPTTLLVKEPVAPLHVQNASSTTRLITTVEPGSIKVNQLIITLAESSAGSDDELELSRCYTYTSSLSQAMDSASNSTTRSNTPNSEILDSTPASNNNLRRTVINEYFEKKLDDFLKQARSKVPTASPLASAKPTLEGTKEKESSSTQKPTPLQQSNKAKPTPVAVRHLPVASQKEYLRLIERMQLLEKKKLAETVKSPVTASNTAGKKATTTKATSSKAAEKTTKAAKKTVEKKTPAAAAKTASESSSSLTEATASGTTPAESSKAKELPSTSKVMQPSKESRLKAFENSYLRIGGSMVANLEKSVRMVEEARLSKIARVRYKRRLEELLAEVLAVKQAAKLEEVKLSRIQPEIQASHEIIMSLKQKRNKLRNAAMDLGNDLRGSDYRLPDPGKTEIMRKSTQLTKEIRLYNSIVKYEDTLDLPAEPTTEKETAAEPGAAEEPESAAKPESLAEPETVVESEFPKQPEPAAVPEPTAEIAPRDSSPQDEPEQTIASDSIDVTLAEVAVAAAPVAAVATRLDVDTTPQDAAIDAMPNLNPNPMPAKKQAKDAPPYTVSFMRELCDEAPAARDSLLGEYRTPMSRNYNSQLNINATMCPFELMGRCEDVDCLYLHLTRASTAVTATATAIATATATATAAVTASELLQQKT